MEDAADHGVAVVIMVISTPEAEAIVRKSGLSVVDLFRPFGDVEDLNGASRSLPPRVPFRSSTDAPAARVSLAATVQTVGEPYQLRKFSMRFADVSEMREMPQESSDKHMMRLMAQYDHEQIWMPKIDNRPVDPTAPTRAPMPDWALDAMDGENASAQASWFAAVRKQLVACAAYAEHSTVDHPVACLHVAASSQPWRRRSRGAGASSRGEAIRRGLTERRLWRLLWRASLSPPPSLLRPPSLPRLPPPGRPPPTRRNSTPRSLHRVQQSLLVSSGCRLPEAVHLTAAPVRRRGPVGVFNALFGAARLPTSLREGMADYNLVKCYVLLHDLTSGPANSQAAADGLQVAACSAPRGGERSAARMPCAPRAASVASAPQAAARRPPRGHSGPRCPRSPTLPPLSHAAPALHRGLSPSAAGDLARLRPRRVQGAADQLARRRRAAAARPVDGLTATRAQPLGRSAPSAHRGARRAAVGRGHGAGAHPGPRPPDPGPRPSTLTRTLDPTPDPDPGPGPEPYPRPRIRPRSRPRTDAEQVRKLVAGPLAKLALGHLQQRVVQISATVKASRQGVKNMVRSARGVGGRASHACVCPW